MVLDLYARRFQERRLEPGEFVLSADEKTSIQARCRCHPTLPPAAARAMRVEHEYERGGALAYLAAWDVHQARLFGRCEPTIGIVPFGRLVDQVMSCEPYASARRVFWVVDNGSSHRGQASVDRLQGAWPNLTLIDLPVHVVAVADRAPTKHREVANLERTVALSDQPVRLPPLRCSKTTDHRHGRVVRPFLGALP